MKIIAQYLVDSRESCERSRSKPIRTDGEEHSARTRLERARSSSLYTITASAGLKLEKCLIRWSHLKRGEGRGGEVRIDQSELRNGVRGIAEIAGLQHLSLLL